MRRPSHRGVGNVDLSAPAEFDEVEVYLVAIHAARMDSILDGSMQVLDDSSVVLADSEQWDPHYDADGTAGRQGRSIANSSLHAHAHAHAPDLAFTRRTLMQKTNRELGEDIEGRDGRWWDYTVVGDDGRDGGLWDLECDGELDDKKEEAVRQSSCVMATADGYVNIGVGIGEGGNRYEAETTSWGAGSGSVGAAQGECNGNGGGGSGGIPSPEGGGSKQGELDAAARRRGDDVGGGGEQGRGGDEHERRGSVFRRRAFFGESSGSLDDSASAARFEELREFEARHAVLSTLIKSERPARRRARMLYGGCRRRARRRTASERSSVFVESFVRMRRDGLSVGSFSRRPFSLSSFDPRLSTCVAIDSSSTGSGGARRLRRRLAASDARRRPRPPRRRPPPWRRATGWDLKRGGGATRHFAAVARGSCRPADGVQNCAAVREQGCISSPRFSRALARIVCDTQHRDPTGCLLVRGVYRRPSV